MGTIFGLNQKTQMIGFNRLSTFFMAIMIIFMTGSQDEGDPIVRAARIQMRDLQ